jgi:hypothetical protein
MTDYSYEDEDRIIWMKDKTHLAGLKFVREIFLFSSIRTGPVRPPKGEILMGYATLKKTVSKVDDRGFCRRIFTLLPEDMDSEFKDADAIKHSIPAGAVDPISVQAGKPGRTVLK